MINHKKAKNTHNLFTKSIKNKKSYRPSAKNLHTKPFRHDNSKSTLSLAQKIVLFVIAAALLVIIVAVLFALKYDAKYQVEAKISDLAHDYYETYYYPNAFEDDEALAENFLSKYEDSGLAPVSVRQMILATDAPDSLQTFLQKYCDINATRATFYPESPYAHDSYRAEFNYSCHFE